MSDIEPRYAIVAFPKTASLGSIERLRELFDPQAKLLAAHITLVFPLAGESADALMSGMKEVLDGAAPFEIAFDRVSAADDEYVFLDVGQGADKIAILNESLYSGILAKHRSRDRRFRPHVTVGRMSGTANARRAADQMGRELVLPIVATIDEVTLFRLDSPTSGASIFKVPLVASTNTHGNRRPDRS